MVLGEKQGVHQEYWLYFSEEQAYVVEVGAYMSGEGGGRWYKNKKGQVG